MASRKKVIIIHKKNGKYFEEEESNQPNILLCDEKTKTMDKNDLNHIKKKQRIKDLLYKVKNSNRNLNINFTYLPPIRNEEVHNEDFITNIRKKNTLKYSNVNKSLFETKGHMDFLKS